MTMNDTWGFKRNDDHWKSRQQLIRNLADAASKGGNFLLNIGPTSGGLIPPPSVERLEAIGEWMGRNNEAIVGTDPGLEPWQFYGPSTRRGNRVYLHVLMKPYESLSVRGVKVRHVGDVRPLGSAISLKLRRRIAAADTLFNRDPIGELVIATPDSALDSIATIIAVDFQR
jgi:alpha-L-fucosidase